MNTTSTKLIAILSIVAVGLAATTVSAKDKGNGGNNGNKSINIGNIANLNSNKNSNSNNNNNGNKKGSIAIGIGIGLANSALNSNKNKPCNDGHCYNTTYVHKIYVPVYTCFHPLHCFAWVLPGDTWTTISLREYNNPNFVPAIAAFNGLSLNVPLVVGQQIGLPEIHPNGLLKVSFAPAPAPFILPIQTVAPITTQALPVFGAQNVLNGSAAIGQQVSLGQQAPIGLPNANAIGAPVNSGVGPASATASTPSFAVGSVITLGGQSLGTLPGMARLKLSGVALKADVVEWTDGSVKVRLPELELAGATAAELEVLRADGTMAAKTSLQLTPAATKLAQGN